MASTPTLRLTVGQAIVRFLQAQYSDRDGVSRRLIPAIFGIFGHGNTSGLAQGLVEYGEDLPYYKPCNEQSMVHTAIGFARMNCRLSTLACTSSIGPGSTNMVTGAATATINRLPVLLLPSDYYGTRHQGPVLQQIEHPVSADVSANDCFRPVSRFFDRILRPEQLLTALPEAMRVLSDPVETGAVTLSLPQDVQCHAYDYPESFFERRTWVVDRRLPTDRSIREAAAMLKRARRPIIIAGGGVHYSEAYAELRLFSESLGIPVGETFSGKGGMRQDSPLLVGGAGMSGTSAAAELLARADLVLAVGTRLTDVTTGSQTAFRNPDVRFISINVCGHDAFKNGSVPIVADAREALQALDAAARSIEVAPDPGYADEIAAAKKRWADQVQLAVYPKEPGEAMTEPQLVGILNEEVQSHDVVIGAAGNGPALLQKFIDGWRPSHTHIEFGYSCMGYELPAGLGARMAHPEGEVYVLIGDGTYLMSPSELVTAVQESLKITLIISENHGLRSIWGLQNARVGHILGTEFRKRNAQTKQHDGEYLKIDFAANAASFGARSWHVETPDGLRRALREARPEARPCVIVVETDKYTGSPASGIWWDIEVAEVSHDEATTKLRAEYEGYRDGRRRHPC